MPAFPIDQFANNTWPGQGGNPAPKIQTAQYDQIRWTPRGSTAPDVSNFIPSGYIENVRTQGKTTLADIVAPSSTALIDYSISPALDAKGDDGGTNAQLELGVG